MVKRFATIAAVGVSISLAAACGDHFAAATIENRCSELIVAAVDADLIDVGPGERVETHVNQPGGVSAVLTIELTSPTRPEWMLKVRVTDGSTVVVDGDQCPSSSAVN